MLFHKAPQKGKNACVNTKEDGHALVTILVVIAMKFVQVAAPLISAAE